MNIKASGYALKRVEAKRGPPHSELGTRPTRMLAPLGDGGRTGKPDVVRQ